MANFAEQISRTVDRELEDVEKHCIRPLQVCTCMNLNASNYSNFCRWRRLDAAGIAAQIKHRHRK